MPCAVKVVINSAALCFSRRFKVGSNYGIISLIKPTLRNVTNNNAVKLYLCFHKLFFVFIHIKVLYFFVMVSSKYLSIVKQPETHDIIIQWNAVFCKYSRLKNYTVCLHQFLFLPVVWFYVDHATISAAICATMVMWLIKRLSPLSLYPAGRQISRSKFVLRLVKLGQLWRRSESTPLDDLLIIPVRIRIYE